MEVHRVLLARIDSSASSPYEAAQGGNLPREISNCGRPRRLTRSGRPPSSWSTFAQIAMLLDSAAAMRSKRNMHSKL